MFKRLFRALASLCETIEGWRDDLAQARERTRMALSGEDPELDALPAPDDNGKRRRVKV